MNKIIFEDSLIWVKNSKIPLFIRLLLLLASIPIMFFGLALWPLWYFLNLEPASLGWSFFFTGIFSLLAVELLFLPSAKFRVLYTILILLPFLMVYPKSLKNNYCIRKAPLNQITQHWNAQTGIWKGKPVKFKITPNYNGYPNPYDIYDLQTNGLLESNVEIKDLNGKNTCVGFEFQTRISTIDTKGYGTLPACLGVSIPKCDLDEDYASKTNGYFISQ